MKFTKINGSLSKKLGSKLFGEKEKKSEEGLKEIAKKLEDKKGD